MLAVTHLRLPDADQALADVTFLLTELERRDGFLSGSLGRAMDDPGEWVLVTRWADVGSYRRGLSAYEVKLARPGFSTAESVSGARRWTMR